MLSSPHSKKQKEKNKEKKEFGERFGGVLFRGPKSPRLAKVALAPHYKGKNIIMEEEELNLLKIKRIQFHRKTMMMKFMWRKRNMTNRKTHKRVLRNLRKKGNFKYEL